MPKDLEMTPEQRQLLETVCTSSLFTRGRHARVLRHLAQYSFPNTPTHRAFRKESYLWTQFYEGTDEANRGNVSRDIEAIRKKLREYAEEDGRGHPEKLTIGSGGGDDGYLVRFIRNRPTTNAIEIFWRPHIEGRRTEIIYTEPLFFHDAKQRVWTRNLKVNRKPEPGMPLPEFLPHGEFKPAYNYVPIGEVHALLAINRWLSGQDVIVSYMTTQDEKYNPKTDLVLLGAPRSNPIMQRLQKIESFHYFMGEDWIDDNRMRALTEPRLYEDSAPRGDLDAQLSHVLVTRSPTLHLDHWVTTIAANHTRAIETVCEVLVDADKFRAYIPDLIQAMPKSFQLLFRVEVLGDETETRKLELLRCWPEDLLRINS